jgi:hypothetical protein
VKSGRRKGNKKAYGNATTDEKKRPIGKSRFGMPRFGKRKTVGEVV